MSDILTLEEIGVISALRVDNEIEVCNDGADGFFNDSDLMILFESSNEQFNTFRYRSYPLSEVGKQLLPIVQEESNDDYLIDLGKLLREDLQEKSRRLCISGYFKKRKWFRAGFWRELIGQVKLYLRTRKILSTIIGIEDFSVAEISCYYYYVSVSN